MRTHIDWLTFTFTPHYLDSTVEQYRTALQVGLVDLFGVDVAIAAFDEKWALRERSRAPYTDAWDVGESGITLFASQTLTHATIEISGQGCEALIAKNLLNDLLTMCADRVTRIDIACDIETDIKPTEFVQYTNHERMRSSGYQKSETGETCYVGSQKSDRYARVYRYNQPHPRAHLLRVEHVFRREAAKAVSRACLATTPSAVARAAGETFGWSHLVWQPDMAQPVDISTTKAERKMGGTLYWLVKQCAPAFKRLVNEGVIVDPEGFVREYFLSTTI